MQQPYVRTIAYVALLLLCGCTTIFPTVGPSRHRIEQERAEPATAAIQILDVDDKLTRQLLARRAQALFSETLTNNPTPPRTIGAGDVLEVSIWEAAPSMLFTAPQIFGTGTIATSHATTLPEQAVDEDGNIMIPFAGRIHVAGMSIDALEREIVARLAQKANQPEVLVRMTHNLSWNATVVGEVNTSTRVPLLPGNQRLLDALASAGGVRQPVNKMTIQVTRGAHVYSSPLDTIIRDPRQNVPLQPGDVVTALFQPYSFTALGATGKDDEVNFEAQGITLAQALARVGGLIDSRSNAKGVFIFRLEPQDALDWPHEPVYTTAQGMVPTVFRLDMTDPRSLFLIQDFWMENRDVLYVSNAPINEVQKFLNVLFSLIYPIFQAQQSGLL